MWHWSAGFVCKVGVVFCDDALGAWCVDGVICIGCVCPVFLLQQSALQRPPSSQSLSPSSCSTSSLHMLSDALCACSFWMSCERLLLVFYCALS